MASCPSPFLATVNHHHHHHAPPRSSNCMTTKSVNLFSPPSSIINLHRSFPFRRNSWLGRCSPATNPQSEPPNEKDSTSSSGVIVPFSRFQDTLQIFLAVLFWMSIFFWSCVCDGGNGDQPNKGPRFRK